MVIIFFLVFFCALTVVVLGYLPIDSDKTKVLSILTTIAVYSAAIAVYIKVTDFHFMNYI